MNMHTKKAENEKPTVCITCGEKRDNFPLAGNGRGKWYWRPTCTRCKAKKELARTNAWRNKYKAEHPEEWKRYRRNLQLKKIYKITLENYEEMLAAQGGGCAICGKSESLRDMPVDHCHEQGHIRGILCHWCNKGLGQFFDSPDTLRKAAEYVERNRK